MDNGLVHLRPCWNGPVWYFDGKIEQCQLTKPSEFVMHPVCFLVYRGVDCCLCKLGTTRLTNNLKIFQLWPILALIVPIWLNCNCALIFQMGVKIGLHKQLHGCSHPYVVEIRWCLILLMRALVSSINSLLESGYPKTGVVQSASFSASNTS